MSPPRRHSADSNASESPSSAIDRIGAALAAITPGGAFAVEFACPAEGLIMEVRGIGRVRFPVAARTARSLATIAHPAPFGRREKTLHDRAVRNTGQIDGRDITIDDTRWNRTLEPLLDVVRAKLGLPETVKLVAALDKLLVYGPGQFFKPHQDSERDAEMVASLTVLLPSEFSGGAMVVEHNGTKRTFKGVGRPRGELSLLAFYADCHHEVKPVTRGHRIVLAYHLHQRAVPKTQARKPVPSTAVAHRVTDAIEAYFSTPVSRRYGQTAPAPPDRLVYLLDHEYSEKSLGWERLKSSDRLRVDALLVAAERLECECYLTLADVQENWNCEEGDYHRSWGYDDDPENDEDDPGEADAGDYELLDLNDSTVELRHWVARDGRTTPSGPVTPGADEVCSTRESVDMEPFKSEHEGNMGNYGNTVDHWYHRAAFVMWPRARNFVIRARQSPAWAVNELAKQIKRGAIADARNGALSVLPFWPAAVHGESSKAFYATVFRLAISLDDARIAHDLLSPFRPHYLSPRDLPTFASLVERFGAAWSERVFTSWTPENEWDAKPWVAIMPALFERLQKHAPTHGARFALWLLKREVSAFEADRANERQEPAVWLGDMRAGSHTARLLALFDGARVINADAARKRLVSLVTSGPAALPALHAGELLEACLKDRPVAEVRAFGLTDLHHQVVASLERALVHERAAGDWSIEVPANCSCELCDVLWTFLRDQARDTLSWPLAKERRAHIHGVIDAHGLPVTHVTIHTGSPHTLVLTKQRDLFPREAARRETQRSLLARLQKARRSFAS